MLWLTVFNLFAVGVLGFMADVYSNAEARRAYGYIGAAGTVGAFLGPVLTAAGAALGIANMMLVRALLAVYMLILRLRRTPCSAAGDDAARRSADGRRGLGGLTGRARAALRWLALMVVLGIGVGTLLYNE